MPLPVALLAALSSRTARLSLHEQVAGLTFERQISKCREMETEARLLGAGSENRERHLYLADRWADLAVDIERDYYLLQSR